MLFFAIIFTLFNQYLPYLITSDAKVIVLAAQLLIIAGIFQIFDGAQVVSLGSLRGIGDVNIPTFITFFCLLDNRTASELSFRYLFQFRY